MVVDDVEVVHSSFGQRPADQGIGSGLGWRLRLGHGACSSSVSQYFNTSEITSKMLEVFAELSRKVGSRLMQWHYWRRKFCLTR